MTRHPTHDSEPVYVISVAARMIGVHAQTLRTYESRQHDQAQCHHYCLVYL